MPFINDSFAYNPAHAGCPYAEPFAWERIAKPIATKSFGRSARVGDVMPTVREAGVGRRQPQFCAGWVEHKEGANLSVDPYAACATFRSECHSHWGDYDRTTKAEPTTGRGVK